MLFIYCYILVIYFYILLIYCYSYQTEEASLAKTSKFKTRQGTTTKKG